jgi:hypothetical protein
VVFQAGFGLLGHFPCLLGLPLALKESGQVGIHHGLGGSIRIRLLPQKGQGAVLVQREMESCRFR